MTASDESATAFLEGLAGTDRVTAIDGESVDSANDYRAAIEYVLQRTSADEVKLTHFAATDGARRTLTVAFNGGAPHAFEVEGNTDWIDNAAFVGGLAAGLRAIGYSRRIVAYWGPEFGQEIGFAMLTDAQLLDLLWYGLEKRSVMLYLDTDDVLPSANEDEGGNPEAWERALERFGANG